MEKTCKLSVLITFCNQKAFVKEALDSVVNQKTNFAYEILIGLDGDDPESELLIKDYQRKYENIYLFKCNNSELETISIEKASNNRINLVKNAVGEYFCLLDGDDFYTDNNRFQRLVDVLDKNQEIIGCAHAVSFLNNETKKITEHKLFEKEITIDAEKYINKKLYIFSNLFIFRNIFNQNIPTDFPSNFFNDSTITFYMLKYGKIHYIPDSMLAYRTNVNSIFMSQSSAHRKITALVAAEINHKVLSAYESNFCKRNVLLLIKCLRYIKNLSQDDNAVLSKFAKENNCYFSYSILNYQKLNFKEKFEFIKNVIKYVLKKQYPYKYPSAKFIYFAGHSNLGDCLNLYIIQRLLNINVKNEHKTQANFCSIGSILETFLKKRFQLYFKVSNKFVNVWGTGFIEAPNYKRHPSQKFFRKMNVIALRGEFTKKRCEKILNKNLDNIALGDPGLLANRLIDTSKIKKQYKVGIVLHYVDQNSEYIKNIDIEDCNFIDVTQNPIKVLEEIAKCEVIFSSAMHGLIVADSLGVPNEWIKLSDNVYGGNYKFCDYYSIFDIDNPQPIDLRVTKIDKTNVEDVIYKYPKKIPFSKVKIIQDKLLQSFVRYSKS